MSELGEEDVDMVLDKDAMTQIAARRALGPFKRAVLLQVTVPEGSRWPRFTVVVSL